MLKRNQTLIDNYINHYSDENANFKEFENDESFMRDIIVITNNKMYFWKCSKNLKLNFTFIMFVIEKFIDDEEFVNDVAMNYFTNTAVDNQKSREFRIALAELYEKYHLDYLEKYKNLADRIYLFEKKDAEELMENITNLSWKQELGLGFRIMAERNENSQVIISYLAKQMINEIISKINIEQDIHEKFLSKEEFKKNGINNYLIYVINGYDHYLSKYIEININLLSDYDCTIKKFIQRWDNYNSVVATNILLAIDKKYQKNDAISLTKKEIVNYLIKKFNLKNYFVSLENYKKEPNDSNITTIDDPILLLSDVLFLYELEKIIEKDKISSDKKLVKSSIFNG